uniref:Nucleoside diphosphate kinase-like domain-containing protein n=1 Tax=Physcomitrium patens TaxID=3218 RepID=A0A7I4FIH5_PHYPA
MRIRALYGTDGRMNAVHGSDTVKEAEWEIKFFFPTVILEPYPSSQDAASYFKEHVQPLLLKGLTALAKAKPASEPNAAVRWLAHWLHDHNPRLPLVCICVEKQFEALKEMPIKKFPFY